MITLLFRMKIQGGREHEALAQLEKMAKAVGENEPGVHAYVFHRLQDDPMQLVLYESYQDDEAFQAHMKTPHMTEFQGSIAELFDTSEIHVERLDRFAGVVRG